MRLKDILNPKPIVESQIKVGTMFMVHGYPLLKGLFPQQHYKVTAINGDEVTMEKVNFQGQETNLTTAPVTHKLSSIEAAIQGGENSDMNGLEIVDESKIVESTIKYHKTITQSDWNKKQKDSKIIIKGVHYLMFYDDKIGTYLAPVKIEG